MLISEVVQSLTTDISKEKLAGALKTSVSSITRWSNGQNKPRPEIERAIRAMFCKVCEDKATYLVQESINLDLKSEGPIRKALDVALKDLKLRRHRAPGLSAPTGFPGRYCRARPHARRASPVRACIHKVRLHQPVSRKPARANRGFSRPRR